MKITINVHKDNFNRYIAYDPTGILKGKTYARNMRILKTICLPELKDISIKIYEENGDLIPDQLKKFEGFEINKIE